VDAFVSQCRGHKFEFLFCAEGGAVEEVFFVLGSGMADGLSGGGAVFVGLGFADVEFRPCNGQTLGGEGYFKGPPNGAGTGLAGEGVFGVVKTAVVEF
jgi:hypothetical protein